MLDARIVAMTDVTPELMAILPPVDNGDGWFSPLELTAEFGGRACYQSFDRPNPETADTGDYVRKNILLKGHESVLEHASITVYLQGVSRSLTHELIRHRHLSVSELSQRFLPMREAEYVQPPALRDLELAYAEREGIDWDEVKGHNEFNTSEFFSNVTEAYDELSELLEESGEPVYTRKQIREAARAFMPNATETRIVVTGNLRAWRGVLFLRGSIHADAEIRELAVALFRLFREEAPNAFADMEVVNLRDGRQIIGPVSLEPVTMEGQDSLRRGVTAKELGIAGNEAA